MKFMFQIVRIMILLYLNNILGAMLFQGARDLRADHIFDNLPCGLLWA